MMDRLTPQQNRSLAAFVATLRRDWDRPGIEKALDQAREVAAAADVAVAAIRAAGIDTNRSPAVIPMPGPHWRESETTTRHPQTPKHLRCSTCGQDRAGCVYRWSKDHAFQPNIPTTADPQVDHLKSIKHEFRAELCTHGVRPEKCIYHRQAKSA